MINICGAFYVYSVVRKIAINAQYSFVKCCIHYVTVVLWINPVRI